MIDQNWSWAKDYQSEIKSPLDCRTDIIISAANIEVVFVKFRWLLVQTNGLEKVKEIMLTPINGEITEREPSNGYLIYQDGLPEVEEFIKQYRK
jgi:glutamyl-tRNA(Gln) amidotransferase subunit D